MSHRIYAGLLLCFCLACEPQEANELARPIAEQFIDYYQTRTNWEGFLRLYDDQVVFSDVLLRAQFLSKNEFAQFYNWPDPKLKMHPDFPQVMEIQELLCNDSLAVIRGFFNPFVYDDMTFDDADHMRFTMWLKVNKNGRIIEHIDFIEYPPSILKATAERLLQGN